MAQIAAIMDRDLKNVYDLSVSDNLEESERHFAAKLEDMAEPCEVDFDAIHDEYSGTFLETGVSHVRFQDIPLRLVSLARCTAYDCFLWLASAPEVVPLTPSVREAVGCHRPGCCSSHASSTSFSSRCPRQTFVVEEPRAPAGVASACAGDRSLRCVTFSLSPWMLTIC